MKILLKESDQLMRIALVLEIVIIANFPNVALGIPVTNTLLYDNNEIIERKFEKQILL